MFEWLLRERKRGEKERGERESEWKDRFEDRKNKQSRRQIEWKRDSSLPLQLYFFVTVKERERMK